MSLLHVAVWVTCAIFQALLVRVSATLPPPLVQPIGDDKKLLASAFSTSPPPSTAFAQKSTPTLKMSIASHHRTDRALHGTGVGAINCGAGAYHIHTGIVIKVNGKCYPCPLGKYLYSRGKHTVSSTYCQPCKTGYYADHVGASMCKGCPNGWYQDATSRTSCKLCSDGKFTKMFKSTISTVVPGTVVKVDIIAGQPTCENCPAGWYSKDDGICIKCALGTYQPSTGLSTCQNCPSSYNQNKLGSKDCKKCEPGKHSEYDASKQRCDLCEVGTYGKITTTPFKHECKQCPKGWYQGTAGETQCKFCPAGYTMSKESASYCGACIIGRFKTDTHSETTVCDFCPEQTYQDQSGQASCKDCAAGKGSSTLGNSVCSPCPAGRFEDIDDMTCKNCSPGYFTEQINMQDCVACPIGWSQSESSSSLCVSFHRKISRAHIDIRYNHKQPVNISMHFL